MEGAVVSLLLSNQITKRKITKKSIKMIRKKAIRIFSKMQNQRMTQRHVPA